MRRIFAVSILLALAGCATTSPAPRVPELRLPPEQRRQAAQNLRIFDRVWSTLDRSYYDREMHGVDWEQAARDWGPPAARAPDREAFYAHVNGMLALLEDSHVGVLPPTQADELRRRARPLTGLNLRRIEDQWLVAGTVPGSAAAEAGIQPGWLVVRRDGEEFSRRLELPRLTPGQVVRWEFLTADDRTVEIALPAQVVSTTRLEERALPEGFSYLRFDDFTWANLRWLSGRLKALRGTRGLVLDLRSNRGGTVISLMFALGEFAGQPARFGTLIRRSGGRLPLRALRLFSANFDRPLVILTDLSTASAAEVLSAALQESGRAKVVGRKTGGNVLAARMASLPDGGLFVYSISDILTASGRRLEGAGVVPDHPVVLSLAELRQGRDPDLEAAVEVLRRAGDLTPPLPAAR